MVLRKIQKRESPEERGLLYNIIDVLLNVVIIVAVVAVIRTFLVSPFEVEGNSMVPTLEDNQYIIISKISYIIGEPKRGDVVVFRPPTDAGKYYVKRVIGIPGDEIVLRDGKVYLANGNEEEIIEPYLDDRNRDRTYPSRVAGGTIAEERYTVPAGEYFLLGDNRQGSLDSRSFRTAEGKATPFVPKESLSGLVKFVALPITKSHALSEPDYGPSVPLQ